MAYKDFYHLMLEYFSQPVELFTGGRKLPFILFAEEQKLFIRNARNNTSRIVPNEVSAFIERFEESDSLLPKDYHDVTFKASYLLSAMQYIAEKNSPFASTVRFHSEELKDSEQKYKKWLMENPEGYILNLLKKSEVSEKIDLSASTCLHSVKCSAVNNERVYSQPFPFTGGDYFKICSMDINELEKEAIRITKLSQVKKHSCIKDGVIKR